jgi:rSAM/selenodomain-associated transferase 1
MPMEVRSAISDCTLVVMAKAPRPGVVKTRLAGRLPPDAILGLYRCLLEDTLQLAQSLDGIETAMMSPAGDVEALSNIAGSGVRVVAQTGNGLAAALTAVFEHFAVDGRRVVAFNSDSPHLPLSTLQQAFEALTSCDLVVGPTRDGGYYLVGATAHHPGLFASAGLGTTNALETLLTRASSLKLSVRLTDPFYDIDVPADLARLMEELRLTPERAPRTAGWLAQCTEAAAPGAGDL